MVNIGTKKAIRHTVATLAATHWGPEMSASQFFWLLWRKNDFQDKVNYLKKILANRKNGTNAPCGGGGGILFNIIQVNGIIMLNKIKLDFH